MPGGNFSTIVKSIRNYSSKSKQFNEKKLKFIPTKGNYPKGFKVGGGYIGIKKNGNKDLAILISEKNASAAGMFTTNKFKAAPVIVDEHVLSHTNGLGIKGIVINSGCANAVTGEQGIKDAKKMIATLDELSNSKANEKSDGLPHSLVMSTGVIGQPLSMDKIVPGIKKVFNENLGNTHKDWINAAESIMTTDTFPKLISKEFKINSNVYSIAGMAKGAGMIHPNMATMLAFFVTDAPIEPTALKSILKYAVSRSFNSISVDGDTSTNDTVAAIANGAAGGEVITESSDGYVMVRDIITEFAISLAQLVVRDGEGATKFVTISIEDAETFQEASKAASAIARSPLFKTAMFGCDANWGRVVCAVGYSDVTVNPNKTSVSFIPSDGSPELKLLVDGEPQKVDEKVASKILSLEDIEVKVSLGTNGGHSAKYWTCDFSYDYVSINADYRS